MFYMQEEGKEEGEHESKRKKALSRGAERMGMA